MKSSRRPSPRRSQENRRRRNSFLNGTTRRLCAEQLESRMLLAGDVLHNIIDPCDTNDDGWLTPADALHVINKLNRQSAGAPSGEGEPQTQQYLTDVDADGLTTAHDGLLVINRLNNAEGESTPLVQYTIQALKTDGTLLGGPIQKGTDYFLQVLVKDLRNPNATTPPDKPEGLFSAWLDVLYNKSLASVEIEEIQTITFSDAPSGGNFTLTFNGNTTGNIAYSASNAQTTAANIQTALQGLTSIGSGNVQVQPVNLADPTVYTVRFQGARGDQDVSMLTANPAGLTPSGQHINIAETIKGVYSPASFLAAFRFGTALPTGPFVQDGQSADPNNNPPLTADPNRINDAGAAGGFTAYPQPTQNKELFRVRMNTLDAGTLSLLGNVTDVLTPSHNTLLRGRDEVVTPDLITIINHSLAAAPEVVTITEPFSANSDTFNFTETAAPAARSLNVKANDSLQAAPVVTTVTKINGGTAPVNLSIGTVTLTSGAVAFTPLANVNGSASFTYTLSNGTITDTATVTVNVSAVNNAPVNTVPGAQSTPEDTAKVINGISIADLDVNETPNATMRVDLTVQNGKIVLQNVPGAVVFLGGTTNNAASISIQGSLADLNTAINGLLYTPTQDFNGADTFRIITNDLNNTGSGGAKSDNDTVAITVTAVNDAPIVTAPAATQNPTETIDLTFNAANSNQISVADLDVGEATTTVTGADKNKLKVTLTVAGSGNTPGTLTLGSTANVTFLAGANNTSSMTIRGALVDVNNAIDNLVLHTIVGGAGSQTLTVSVDDLGNSGSGGALTDSEIVNINVIPLTRPYAFPDSATVLESSTNNSLDVLNNDLIDDDATGKVLVSVGAPAHGSTSPSGNQVLYTPTADFWGTDTFTYVMNETGHPGSEDSTGTVMVNITNDPDNPVAVGDSTNVDEDTSTDIAVLGNDSDRDDNNNAGFVSTLTPVIVAAPSHGTVSVLANGKIRYTAGAGVGNQNYNGPDSFTYKIHDETNRESGTVTVNITVNSVNDKPTGQNQSFNASEDVLLSVPAPGLKTGAADVDTSLSSVTVAIISPPTNSSVFNFNAADGSFNYQGAQNFSGTDTFTYQLNDGESQNNLSNTFTVTISIAAVNDNPVAVNDSYNAAEDTLLTVPVGTGVRNSNDSDVDNAITSVNVELLSGPTNAKPGSFALNSNGSFTYQGAQDFNGTDSFTYRLNDGQSQNNLSNTATVTINIGAANDAPAAANLSYAATEDTTLNVNQALGLQTGGSDVDNASNTLKVIVVSQPNHGGSLSVNPNTGAFDYTPAQHWNGKETFTYQLNDSQSQNNLSNTATVTFNIQETNDPPTARNDGTPVRLTMIKNFNDQEVNVLANDDASPDFVVGASSDFNNVPETLKIISVGSDVNASNGLTSLGNTVRISADGKKVLFDDTQHIEANDQFSYTIADYRGGVPTGTQATATVFLEVVNFIPTEITGKVFVDNFINDGVQQSSEKPLAGVKITLQGHDNILNIDFGADTDSNPANDVAALVVYTDINGNYRFDAPGGQQPGMRPGTYTITEEQPAFMRDGIDTAGNTATVNANDQFRMILPLLGVPGGILGNNFAERGLDPSIVSINEILASSGGNGLILAINGSSQLWSSQLAGWTNLKSCSVVLSSDTSTATFTFTDLANNVSVRTISQVGNPRFRLMGRAADGSELIRVDGTAADFGLNLMAAGSQSQQAEGEADGDDGYTRSVDELMTAVGNA